MQTLHEYFNEFNGRVRKLKQPVLAFYINSNGNRLTHDDDRTVVAGETHGMPKHKRVWDRALNKTVTVDDVRTTPRCCSRGMHASPTLLEAASYTSLPENDHCQDDEATIWLVELSGKVHLQRGTTRKAAAEYRRYIEGRRVKVGDVKRLMMAINKLRLPSTRTRILRRSKVTGMPLYRTRNGLKELVHELRPQPVFHTLRDVRNALSAWLIKSPQREGDRAKVDRVIRKWLATLPVVEAAHGTDSQPVA